MGRYCLRGDGLCRIGCGTPAAEVAGGLGAATPHQSLAAPSAFGTFGTRKYFRRLLSVRLDYKHSCGVRPTIPLGILKQGDFAPAGRDQDGARLAAF